MKDPVSWLSPPIEPYETGRLPVSPVHEIYFEESGNLPAAGDLSAWRAWRRLSRSETARQEGRVVARLPLLSQHRLKADGERY